jgi:hypothetical protein
MDNGMRSHNYLIWLSLVVISIAGGGLIAFATRGGIGAESDTASYISAARNLVGGKGFGIYYPSGRFVFFSYWAPLFSLVLAVLSHFPDITFEIVRWMNVTLFSLLVLLIGSYTYYFSRSELLSGLISILVAFSPLFIGVYVTAMSEPLYYFFGLAGLFGTLLYIDKLKPVIFYLSAFSLGLAVLTRYSAIPFIMVACLVMLIFPRLPLNKRIWKSIVFGLTSMLGLGIWFWMVWLNTATLGGRQFNLGGESRQLFNAIKSWFITKFSNWLTGGARIAWIVDPHHYRLFWIGLMILLLIASGLFIHYMRKKYRSPLKEIPGMRELLVFISFIIFYSSFLVVSYVFSAPFGLVGRLFSPIELFSLLLLIAIIAVITRSSRCKKMFVIFAIPLVFFSITTIVKGIKAVSSYPVDGLGYNTRQARDSVILMKLREFPADIKLISNEGPFLLFHVNEFPYLINEINQETPDWDFKVYGGDRSDEAQVDFFMGKAALVLFPSIVNDFSLLYGDQAAKRVEKFTEGLFMFYSGEDGSIYFYRKPDFVP